MCANPVLFIRSLPLWKKPFDLLCSCATTACSERHCKGCILMRTIKEDAKKVGLGRKATHDLFYYCSINKLMCTKHKHSGISILDLSISIQMASN